MSASLQYGASKPSLGTGTSDNFTTRSVHHMVIISIIKSVSVPEHITAGHKVSAPETSVFVSQM